MEGESEGDPVIPIRMKPIKTTVLLACLLCAGLAWGQEDAAPEETEARTVSRSRPASCAYNRASQTPSMFEAMSVWLTILACWPEPGPP